MKTPIRAPMLGLALCFGAGIFCAKSGYVILGKLCLPIGLCYVFCVFWDRMAASIPFERIYALLIYSFFACLGTSYFQAYTFTRIEAKLGHVECRTTVLLGKVISERKTTSFGHQAWVELSAYRKDSSWVRAEGRFQVQMKLSVDTAFQQGDELRLRAFVKPILGPQKGYYAYLLKNNIRHMAYAKDVQVRRQARGFRHHMRVYQEELAGYIEQQILDPSIFPLAQAMFLGKKTKISKETRTAFAGAGLSHMLAISGMHVGIIFLCINFLFMPLNLFLQGRRIKKGLILLVLLGYMLLSGASPAVVRAVCMLSIVLMCQMLYRKYSLLNVLAVSAWIQMLVDPNCIFQIGFQLSYIAVVGLVLFMPAFQAFTKTPYFLLNAFLSCMGVSLIASCFTAPLSLYYFGQFPVYFLLSNLLASCIAFVLVFTGFVWLLCIKIPILNLILAEWSENLLYLLYIIAQEITRLPHAVLDDFSWENQGLQILLAQLLLAGCLICLPWVLRKLGK